MNILIHACEQREEYVRGFLIPELIRQGWDKDKIVLWVDHGRGNLQAYLGSYAALPDTGDWWHLEDDVLPDGRFFKYAQGLSHFPGIVCGFGAGLYYGLRDFGYVQDPSEIFYSFPCIRIPCEVVKSFLRWLEQVKDRFKKTISSGAGIDYLFREYIKTQDVPIFNFKPCLVEHIDDLLGGSLVNPERGQAKAVIFEDPGALARLQGWKEGNDGAGDTISGRF